MRQLIAVAIAILLIPVLLKLKVPTGQALLILSVVAGLMGGLGPVVIGRALLDVFLVPSTLSSVLVVVEIGMLSALMNHYGILKRMEVSMRELIPNPRVNIMLLPTMVGALQAPGGAALSAGFVNRLGTEMGLNRSQRSNINVVSRHVLMLFAPFASNMVIVKGAAPEVDILKLGALNLAFVILMQAAGYFFLVRKSQPIAQSEEEPGSRAGALKEFFLTFSPILLVILLNNLMGIPFPVALLGSMALVYLLGDRKEFGKQLVKSVKPSLFLLIVGVYFFQNIVGSMSELLALFGELVTGRSELMFMGMVALVGLVFGLATGLMYLPLGVLIPLVAAGSYGSEMEMLIHLSYTFLWCFIGYFFSPLHLCQLLSDKETGCTVGERYRTYIPLMILLPVFPAVLYFLYNLVLL